MFVAESNRRVTDLEAKVKSEAAWWGAADKMWDGITRVIKMGGKVEGSAATVKDQQTRIEDLAGRVIRLE